MIIKACLFDLDGVVVDTAKYHYLAWKELADELGFEFSEQHNERLKGVSRMQSLKILLEVGGMSHMFSDKEKLEMAERKNTRYVEFIKKITPEEILPGAKGFILELRSKGIKTAIGSASKNARFILDGLKITELFDAIVDGTIVTSAKPDPEIFLKGAEMTNTPAANCVVLEDAEAGIEAAINAGMRSVGIGDPKILGKADVVVKNLEGMTLEKLNMLIS
jgi:beta-phosphoglucomutase